MQALWNLESGARFCREFTRALDHRAVVEGHEKFHKQHITKGSSLCRCYEKELSVIQESNIVGGVSIYALPVVKMFLFSFQVLGQALT